MLFLLVDIVVRIAEPDNRVPGFRLGLDQHETGIGAVDRFDHQLVALGFFERADKLRRRSIAE